MGWFDKKEESEKKLPELPELPRLPEFPKMNSIRKNLSDKEKESLPQLPSFPSSSFGQKFSQNAIKEAVAGERGDKEDFDVDDSEEEIQMIHKSPKRIFTNEISPETDSSPSAKIKEIENYPREIKPIQIRKENEPVFVRIDKFEEGIKTLEKAKEEITEIEKMLKDTKSLKEEEEIQLEKWEKEIQKIKKQIENIDTEIFSKVE
jgi:chromosome segregation ATPase